MSTEQEVPITELMGTYLDLPSTHERYFDLALLAAELHTNRTPGCNTRKIEGITTVPVNTHEDGDLVWAALKSRIDSLANYRARTQTVFSLYGPPGVPSAKTQAAKDAVRTFAKENKSFPFSFYETVYAPDTPMAVIRGDLTDSALLWISQLGKHRITSNRKDDFYLFSNTIDEISRTPGYETEMLRNLAKPWTAAVRGMVEYAPTGRPNIDKSLGWRSLPLQASIEVSDANLAVSLRNVYVPAGGYGRDAVQNESAALLRRASQFKQAKSSKELIKTAHEAVITSSGRLLVDAALQGVAPWEASVDSIGSTLEIISGEGTDILDISDETYRRWVGQYQVNLLHYGGKEILDRRGKIALQKFVSLVNKTRTRLGGDLNEADLVEAMQLMTADDPTSKRWPGASHFLL